MPINSNNDKQHSVQHIQNMGFDRTYQLPMVEAVSLDPSGNVLRPISGLITIVDTPDSSLTYIGTAQPGTPTDLASWRIQQIIVSGSVTTMKWADGDQNFDNIWDNRGDLSYS